MGLWGVTVVLWGLGLLGFGPQAVVKHVLDEVLQDPGLLLGSLWARTGVTDHMDPLSASDQS